MMKLFRVAAGVLNQTPLDWEGNLQRVFSCIQQAESQGVSVLCLPEMCLTGYGCEDAFLSPEVQERSLQQLQEIAAKSSSMAICVGLPFVCAGALFNGVAMVAGGKVLGISAKQHLAGDGIHYEPRWFKAWPSGQMVPVDIGGQSVPVGDLVYNFQGIRIGLEICEDAWVGPRPGSNLAQRGVDMILNPSASHFAFGKHEVRRRFILEGSRAFQVTYVYANLLGNESGRAIFDGDAMIASGGKLLAAGERFGFVDTGLVSAVVDVDWTRMVRVQTASFRPQIAADEIGDEVVLDRELPKVDPEKWASSSQLQLESKGHSADQLPTLAGDDKEVQVVGSCWADHLSKEEEFTLAVSLGLFDYARKSRSRGFVVSLSGGADSAAVTVLCRLSIALAVGQRGLQSVQSMLGVSGSKINSESQLAAALITTVYQGTVNSGQVTRDAASQVAQIAQSTHYQWNVDEVIHSYQDVVQKAIGRELTWADDDITLQNIQARSRAPGVWMLANIRGALLLATSNRSEAAVGYATMDGDTSGGLSPIAGIDKNFLRHWLRWVETKGPKFFGSIPGLKCINDQSPTAELRPQDQNQTDESDLMPYDVLDAAERLAIRDKIAPKGVFFHLQRLFPIYQKDQLKEWTKRFFRLWSRNQWKRERYAPSFHLDDENLDPKTWCRWPILNGGFEQQLKELD